MLKNGIYNFSGGIARIIISIITIPFLIRFIGLEEYGLWILASTIVGVVTLAEAGLTISTTVFVSRDLAADDNISLSQTLTISIGAMFLFATVAALVLWIGAAVVVKFYPHLSPEQQTINSLALQTGCIVVWVKLMQQVLVGIAQALQLYGILNILNTTQILFTNAGLVTIAWLGGRINAFMWWTAIISILMLVAYVAFTSWILRGRNVKIRWSSQRARELGSYSAVTWFGSLGGMLFSQGDKLIVGSVLSPVALGVYAIITTVTVQINTLSALSVQPLLPAISAQHAVSSGDDLISDVQRAFQIITTIVLAIGLSLVALAPILLKMFLDSIPTSEQQVIFYTGVVIYVFYSLNAVGYYMLLGSGKVVISTVVILLSGIVALILIWIGARTFSLFGAVLGNVGYLGTLLLNFIALRHWCLHSLIWVRWVFLPILWFALMLPTTLLLPRPSIISVSVLVVQIIVLFAWFGYVQRHSLGPLVRRLSQVSVKL